MKTSSDGTPLAGAESSELAPAEGSAFADGSTEPARLFATGEDGSVDLPFAWMVVSDTYTLTEVTGALRATSWRARATFTVGEDGALALAADTPTRPSGRSPMTAASPC